MLSRRAVILLSLASAIGGGLGFAVWRRVNSPAERNRRVVLRWLDQRIDMPYDDGYTLDSAITHFYRRTGGRHGTGIVIFTDFNAGGRARMEKALATPIHYSSQNLPLGQSLTEMLRPFGLDYYVDPNPRQPLLIITSLEDAADHEAKR